MQSKLSFLSLIGVVLLAGGFIFLFRSQQELASRIGALSGQPAGTFQETKTTTQDTCGEECQKTIQEEVASAISTISGTPKTTTTVTTPAAAKNTSYISLSGPVSTTSTQWVDIPGVEVYIDLANDYGKGATAGWEANLKVAHGNGQAFARLFDVTHGTAVDGSEVSTTNNADYKIVSSSNIYLWAGRNLYRLQLKSLNSFEVTFLSGHIKVTYWK
jgi:hypothetical protein